MGSIARRSAAHASGRQRATDVVLALAATLPAQISLRTGATMQLWNDYEGRTIAEAYPLNKLVRPEGRSAFFLTTNGTGTPAMVRVIEAHFDESEILHRWRV